MSPRLPVVSGADVVRALGKVGFSQLSQRGSHVKLANEVGRTAIVPMHRELAPGTLRSVFVRPVSPSRSSSSFSELSAMRTHCRRGDLPAQGSKLVVPRRGR